MTHPKPEHSLDGAGLRAAFAAAAAHLRASAAAVDAINVYPVPDGDTGSNMAATLAEAVAAVGEARSVSEVAAALARGALYGARGNSGVILSQALRGFSAGLAGIDTLDGPAFADALRVAAERAYAAVTQPVEGTMLTVLREATTGAASGGVSLTETLAATVAAAEAAEARTPTQMAMLAEAGVTDAGGEGICVILRGLLAALRGELAAVREPAALPRPGFTDGTPHADFGFCTEFLVQAAGVPVDLAALRACAGAGDNRSVVVVGDGDAAHVHVHTDAPEPLLEAVRAFGEVSRVKVEDMTAQHGRFTHTGSGAGARCAVLALSPGPGFGLIFDQLGIATAALGSLAKPSAGEIASAADALHCPDVILLPNHKDVVLAAKQASELATCSLHVVPTTSLPAGIAAALAFDGAASASENIEIMLTASEAVRTVEVTHATADRRADGIDARAGDAIALLDDVLVAASDSDVAALVAGLEAAGCGDTALVTVYTGNPGPASAEVETALIAAFPQAEVQVLEGGQPLYSLIASLE